MTAPGEGAASLEELRRQIASIPDALREASRMALPSARAASVVTTGIGGSEGPARLLAGVLGRDGSCSARFVPLAAFHAGTEPAADLLIVFSQGLSPNADLALRSRRARKRWVVTSVGYRSGRDDRVAHLEELVAGGVVPIQTPPGVERGMLARIVGPQVASLVALRLAGRLGAPDCAGLPFEEAADAWPFPREVPALPAEGVALVTDASSCEWAFGLRWKLLEALLLPDPPTYDALQVAHGPLQSFFERRMTLVVLETPAAGDLVDRLRAVTHPERHRIERVRARRSDPLGYFDHAAAVDAMVQKALERRPRDLGVWPARGHDQALYGITR